MASFTSDMYAKLITCTVDPTLRDRFSQAQNAWSECSGSSGFKKQLGGWDLKHDRAIILSCWNDEKSLSAFMLEKHDEIASKSMQVHTYQKCVIQHLRSHSQIAGNKLSEHRNPRVLRVTDCHVSPEKSQRFFTAQESIWNPGMQECDGFCGGFLSRHKKESHRYFVITQWSTIDDHTQYVQHMLPRLKNESDLAKTLDTVQSSTVALQNDWEIIPT